VARGHSHFWLLLLIAVGLYLWYESTLTPAATMPAASTPADTTPAITTVPDATVTMEPIDARGAGPDPPLQAGGFGGSFAGIPDAFLNALGPIPPAGPVFVPVPGGSVGQVQLSSSNFGYGAEHPVVGQPVSGLAAGQLTIGTPVVGYDFNTGSWNYGGGGVMGGQIYPRRK